MSADEDGFALLEVLVAMVIMTLAVSGMLGTFHYLIATHVLGSRYATDDSEFGFARQLLGSLFRAAHPLNAQENGFRGASDELTFQTSYPMALGGGPAKADIKIQVARNGTDLIFLFSSTDADDHKSQHGHLRVRGVARFEYLRAGAGSRPVWLNRWDDAQSLPGLIRLRIEDGASVRYVVGAPSRPDVAIACLRAPQHVACGDAQ